MKQSRLPSYLIIAILVLLPFHAFFTTWAGSNFGHLDLWRIWKELLLIPLGLYAAWLVWQDKALGEQWGRSWLVRCVVLYTLLFCGFGLVVLAQNSVSPSAVIYSLLTNLRFLWFMLMTWAIGSHSDLVYRHWRQILLIPASLVVGFGLLQWVVLPIDWLRHFGYGPSTIPASATIDQKLDFRRVQSFLRGANPLGAYLVLVLTAVAASLRRHWTMCLLLVAGLAAMFLSYSRSAWIGLAVALAVLAWQRSPKPQLRQSLLLIFAGLLLMTASLTWGLRNNDWVQNTIFHTDEKSQSSQSSNSARFNALQIAAQEVADQPMGAGPGTAGPASQRNQLARARIAENYYLQIGQEVGLIGLGLFVAINLLIGWQLWRQKNELSQILVASLIGLTVVNMLSHAWADDTLALLWWGFAGVSLASPAILKRKQQGSKRGSKAAQKIATT